MLINILMISLNFLERCLQIYFWYLKLMTVCVIWIKLWGHLSTVRSVLAEASSSYLSLTHVYFSSITVVIALISSNVILKEDLEDAESWRDVYCAFVKFFRIRFRAICYIAISWGLSMWSSIDYIVSKGVTTYLYS